LYPITRTPVELNWDISWLLNVYWVYWVDVILDDVKKNAHEVSHHMQLLIARTAGVEREINYLWTYIVKFMRWLQGSIKIINFLDQLIQGLSWADRNVLSPLIIQTSSLLDMLVYVRAHLEQNTMLKLIPVTMNEIHEMVSFYMVSIKGTLLVVLDIPLTSYPGPLEVFEIRGHPIRVPNSALDSVLELEYTHVAIHRETGVYVVLSAEDVQRVKTSRRHLMQYPTMRKDVNTSCVMALYKNERGRVKRLCKYVVSHGTRQQWQHRLNVWTRTFCISGRYQTILLDAI